MSNIVPIGKSSLETSFTAVTTHENKSLGDYHSSSLRSENENRIGNSIYRFFTWPIRIVKNIFNWIKSFFCGPNTENQEKLAERKTKEVFSGIYTAVITSKDLHKKRQELYEKSLSELSDVARMEFKKYVAFSIGKLQHPPILDRALQENFYKENVNKIDFNEYLDNIQSKVLIDAVQSFQNDLETDLNLV